MSSYRVRSTSPVELEETTRSDCTLVVYIFVVARLNAIARSLCGFDFCEEGGEASLDS